MPAATEAKLTTTFALALAMPLIVIPFERNSEFTDMNELQTDRQFAEEFARLKDANFFAHFLQSPKLLEMWRFVAIHEASSKGVRINSPHTWRDDLGRHPLQSGAVNQLKEQSVDRILYTMRNALSHATIVYLNEQGLEQHDREVTHLAFVSRKRRQTPHDFYVLIVEQQEFVRFLRAWVQWLQQIRLDDSLLLAA
jgi:hypothetical protein